MGVINDLQIFQQWPSQLDYGTSTGDELLTHYKFGTRGPFIPNNVERIFYDPYEYPMTPDECYKEPSDVVIVHVAKPIKVNLSLIN